MKVLAIPEGLVFVKLWGPFCCTIMICFLFFLKSIGFLNDLRRIPFLFFVCLLQLHSSNRKVKAFKSFEAFHTQGNWFGNQGYSFSFPQMFRTGCLRLGVATVSISSQQSKWVWFKVRVLQAMKFTPQGVYLVFPHKSPPCRALISNHYQMVPGAG